MSDKIYLLFAALDDYNRSGLEDLVGAYDSIADAKAVFDQFGTGLTGMRYEYGEIYDYDTLRAVLFYGRSREWIDYSVESFHPPALAQLQVLLDRRNLSQAIGSGALTSNGNGGRL